MRNQTRTELARLVLDGPTLTQIACEAEVTVSYVSQIAAGRKPPSPRVKAAASKVLRLPVETIFPDSELAEETDEL